MFKKEEALLRGLIGRWLVGRIEHIGSTGVPGLIAKPVIDIMFGVSDLNACTDAIAVLEANNYCYYPYKAEVMHWLCKPSPEFRTHHLHLVPFESALWNERLVFRDKLRADKNLAAEYACLKRTLAAANALDREAYTDKKWPFIKEVVYG